MALPTLPASVLGLISESAGVSSLASLRATNRATNAGSREGTNLVRLQKLQWGELLPWLGNDASQNEEDLKNFGLSTVLLSAEEIRAWRAAWASLSSEPPALSAEEEKELAGKHGLEVKFDSLTEKERWLYARHVNWYEPLQHLETEYAEIMERSAPMSLSERALVSGSFLSFLQIFTVDGSRQRRRRGGCQTLLEVAIRLRDQRQNWDRAKNLERGILQRTQLLIWLLASSLYRSEPIYMKELVLRDDPERGVFPDPAVEPWLVQVLSLRGYSFLPDFSSEDSEQALEESYPVRICTQLESARLQPGRREQLLFSLELILDRLVVQNSITNSMLEGPGWLNRPFHRVKEMIQGRGHGLTFLPLFLNQTLRIYGHLEERAPGRYPEVQAKLTQLEAWRVEIK